jgi:hypothetical protein
VCARGVLTARVPLRSRTPAGEDGRLTGSCRRISTLPRHAAGTTSFVPVTGRNYTLSVKFLDHPVDPGDEPSIAYRVASGGFFAAAGVPVKRGRLLSDEDTMASPLVAVVNEVLAKRHFPGEDPIGREIVIGDRVKQPRRIVGIVGNVLGGGTRRAAAGGALRAGRADPVGRRWRCSCGRAAIRPRWRRRSGRGSRRSIRCSPWKTSSRSPGRRAVARRAPVRDAAFSAPSPASRLLLAAVGIYGVVAFPRGPRVREVGIRMAGRARADVLALFLSESARRGSRPRGRDRLAIGDAPDEDDALRSRPDGPLSFGGRGRSHGASRSRRASFPRRAAGLFDGGAAP